MIVLSCTFCLRCWFLQLFEPTVDTISWFLNWTIWAFSFYVHVFWNVTKASISLKKWALFGLRLLINESWWTEALDLGARFTSFDLAITLTELTPCFECTVSTMGLFDIWCTPLKRLFGNFSLAFIIRNHWCWKLTPSWSFSEIIWSNATCFGLCVLVIDLAAWAQIYHWFCKTSIGFNFLCHLWGNLSLELVIRSNFFNLLHLSCQFQNVWRNCSLWCLLGHI